MENLSFSAYLGASIIEGLFYGRNAFFKNLIPIRELQLGEARRGRRKGVFIALLARNLTK